MVTGMVNLQELIFMRKPGETGIQENVYKEGRNAGKTFHTNYFRNRWLSLSKPTINSHGKNHDSA